MCVSQFEHEGFMIDTQSCSIGIGIYSKLEIVVLSQLTIFG